MAQAVEISPAICTNGAEVRDLMLSFAPAAFGSVRAQCAAGLPASSPLQDNSAMMVRYKAAAQAAWPRGKAALLKLLPHDKKEADAQKIVDALTPEMVEALVVPQLVKTIGPGDCRDIDRLVTLLEPMPADNLGDLIAWMVRYSLKKKHTDMLGPIRLCPE
jgi:hypothetical protein